MLTDDKKMHRTAQLVFVESAAGSGSPPSFGEWLPVYDAKVDRIVLSTGSTPDKVTIWFPARRWNDRSFGIPPLNFGDKIRITVSGEYIFEGFIVSHPSDFSGGNKNKGSAFERNAIVAVDYTWLLKSTCPIFGQLARGPDDYNNFGTDSQSPKDSYIILGGRRTTFNKDGRPNKDPYEATVLNVSTPLFADPDIGEYWTAGDMVRYVLCGEYNLASDYYDFGDPADLAGLDHADFNTVLNDMTVGGLNIIDALDIICDAIGWSFRLDYDTGSPQLVFYKLGVAAEYTRSSTVPTILHQLHAPAENEDISTAIAAGSKMLWSMRLVEDIGNLVNRPIGLGAPHRFEFTAELVPGWLDSELVPDTADSNEHLFLTEADLQKETDPDQHSYYKNYHPRGSTFNRTAGRRWCLNESGRYSGGSYDRGTPFDFTTVIESKYTKLAGKRNYAPYNRRLLPCITIDPASKNSVGIKVEFSFDGGSTWQVVKGPISPLKDECGIYIDQANLAEISDKEEGSISGGTLDGVELNYWTSLCDDKVNSRVFKNGAWNTRCRVTASVQMDQRLLRTVQRDPISASPFHHSQIYDLSKKYFLQKRTASSGFDSGTLSAWNRDDSDYFDTHIESIRKTCQDSSVSGSFTLDRLWPNTFKTGDCIEKLTGRAYDLAASLGSKTVYPEIVRIIILPDKQRQMLITRDLRFAEVRLI